MAPDLSLQGKRKFQQPCLRLNAQVQVRPNILSLSRTWLLSLVPGRLWAARGGRWWRGLSFAQGPQPQPTGLSEGQGHSEWQG